MDDGEQGEISRILQGVMGVLLQPSRIGSRDVCLELVSRPITDGGVVASLAGPRRQWRSADERCGLVGEGVVDAQPHRRVDVELVGSAGSTQRTSHDSVEVVGSPPTSLAVKQMENCWRTSPSS